MTHTAGPVGLSPTQNRAAIHTSPRCRQQAEHHTLLSESFTLEEDSARTGVWMACSHKPAHHHEWLSPCLTGK